MGGEEALQRLITRFYDLMESLPEAHQVHRLHFRGHGLEHSRVAQMEFMSGFLGGRAYYRERHGHMDLREIHSHIPIRVDDAEIWLGVWDQALQECRHCGAEIDRLRETVRSAALRLVNDVPDWREGSSG
ncbi:MAG: cyanoglobin [Shimia sp.]|nr:cyanoglobin [Shimia sp.]